MDSTHAAPGTGLVSARVGLEHEEAVMQDEGKPAKEIRLIESDDERPLVRLQPGKRYEVMVTSVVDSNLAAVTEETGAAARPARLCGSRTTCMAIVEF